ncbi:hypothetical protein M9H77_07945 [Catharanthus roseus]|uniref:Uncharacterized protein n=1 Tax=Catharanthus roseus TaxID=4058 RepID=A0ACC0BWK6_CATRO|nr:hypothetical protein M9H77_07945 [Catharanthus roseus]
MDRHLIIHKGNFPNLLHRALAYFFGHKLVQKRSGLSEVRIIDIYFLDKLHNHSPLSLSFLIIQTMRNTGCDTSKRRVIKFITFNICGYSWDEENQVWIPPSEEDRLWDRNLTDFCSIKKTTQTGLGVSSSQLVENDAEADESYNPLDDNEDEAGAHNTVLIDIFQAKIRTSFE